MVLLLPAAIGAYAADVTTRRQDTVATNLIAQLMDGFRGQPLSRLASSLGENAAKTETALGAVIPALVGGLASKASTADGANELFDLIRRNRLDTRQYGDTSAALAPPDGVTSLMNAGRPLVDFVLGGRASSLTDWLTSFAGINRPSATSLLSLALPLVVGQIGRLAGSGGLTASSLQSLLADQRSFLQDAPAGLAAAVGLGDLGRAPSVATYEAGGVARSVQPGATETSTGGGAWWKWALPLLLLALIPAFLILRRPAPPRGAVEIPAVPRAEVPTSGTVTPSPATSALGDLVEKQLPRGVTLRVPSLGVENKLIGFITDPGARVDKETWFSFDRLEFETDSAALKPSSQEQLRNVAQILEAYPQVHIKIGGYTDNVGDDAYNLKLSSERAANTMNELAKLGADRSRLESEGYGETHPIADNSTSEGRQRNRRIDVSVTRK
jgi:OmpA-OmpF porin, OOP family